MVKSLDEVIERLQYKADNIKAKLEPSYFTECIDYLKTLPREDKWIPCSERLPERCMTVLVQVDTKIMVAFCDIDGKWYGIHGGFFMGKPLAWQPLPEPYKGE